MTKKLAIVNYKGGTGKTSTTVNLAYALTLIGQRVLIIDIDAQGSAGYCLGIDPKFTLYEALLNLKPVSECIVNARKNLDIICSNERLFAAELKLVSQSRSETLLSRIMQSVQGYDYIIIDCPPSLNLLNQNALAYADQILVPVAMEYLSLVGIKQLLKNIQIVNKMLGKPVEINRVIPTFFDPRNLKTRHIMNSLHRVFPDKVTCPIRTNVALSEAPGYRQTVFEYDPKSKGALDYLKLAKEVHGHD